MGESGPVQSDSRAAHEVGSRRLDDPDDECDFTMRGRHVAIVLSTELGDAVVCDGCGEPLDMTVEAYING